MKVTPIHDGFAAEISGIDLSKPIPNDIFEALHRAIDEAGVVMFRDQVLSDVQLVDFSQRLGPLEQPLKRDQYGGVHEKVTMLANVDDDGNLIKLSDKHGIYMKGNLLWHSDSSFKPVPCTYSVLSAKEVPSEGGETEFADLRACYDDWQGPFGDIEKEELEDLICEHSIIYSRSLISGDIFSAQEKKEMAPVRQPLVRTHPRTGRKIYYVGSHCSHVEGWPVEKGRALVRELSGFCVRPDHIYSHRWKPNDLVIWDNRSVLHRGRTYDPTQRRIMHRATVGGDGPLL
ncbi:MAG: TauD/TfdA family dioxygenase [Rhizobiales bacterium]|nr:TauD/TfdA family dioxygenase [Hyphomicrobiales bacterium]